MFFTLSLTYLHVDVPKAPPNFNLNPDPRELSILILSWNQPNGTLENVPINYTVTISGPRINRNDIVSGTTYMFSDAEDQTCQEHTFTVFATNPAGPGAVSTMDQTIPICKDAVECLCPCECAFPLMHISMLLLNLTCWYMYMCKVSKLIPEVHMYTCCHVVIHVCNGTYTCCL